MAIYKVLEEIKWLKCDTLPKKKKIKMEKNLKPNQ